jgi:hypothetical protein
MKPKTALLLLAALSFISSGYAQEKDLVKELGNEKPKKQYVYNAFKSTRVIMSQSMEMLKPGVLDFRILHRFGNVNRGLYEFFGLDQATFRLSFDYGITDDLSIGIGRSSHKKELDGFIKYRILHQSTGPGALPLSVVAVAGTTVNTLKWADTTRKNHFSSRLAYFGQLIVGRKFSEALTIQIMPTLVHRNLVFTNDDHNDVYAAGIGGRLKLTKYVSLNVDYYHVFNMDNYYTSVRDKIPLKNPLSIGFDIQTGGHVFQLHFTNAVGMNERVFLTETTNDWGKGDIQFGFNISRVFQIGKKKK